MANGHGGPRTPANPAPVSGPGRLSKRTDGGPGQKLQAPTGMDYGDHAALLAQERVAPMSQTASTPTMDVPPPPGGGPTYSGVPFGAPTTRPNEPITHGVDIGPGGGSEVLPIEHQPGYQAQGPMTQMLSRLSARDQTGVLATLYQSALSAGA